MGKLEKLTQDEEGYLFREDGTRIEKINRVGKLITLIVQNPEYIIDETIKEMAKSNSVLVPKIANAYLRSDFNGGSQHIRINDSTSKESFYSTYAVQFYLI